MKRIPLVSFISDKLLPYFPDLKKKMIVANLDKSPGEFLDWVIMNSLILSFAIALLIGFGLITANINGIYSLLLFIIMLPIGFFYYIHYPDIIILRRKREIERDLVFAIKHIIIEASSGMPLFDAIVGVTKGYGAVSEEFKSIVERVSLGEPLTHVLREVAQTTPSPAFKRVLIQIANSLVSGSDIGTSLGAIVDQISKDQIINIKEYGQKLNPLVMFYLTLGVILPSLGITFLMILLSFTGGGMKITLPYLLLVSLVIGLFQFLFLAYVESSRPRYAMFE